MNYPSNSLPFEMSELRGYPVGYYAELLAAAYAAKADSRQMACPRLISTIDSHYVKNGWEPIEDWLID